MSLRLPQLKVLPCLFLGSWQGGAWGGGGHGEGGGAQRRRVEGRQKSRGHWQSGNGHGFLSMATDWGQIWCDLERKTDFDHQP